MSVYSPDLDRAIHPRYLLLQAAILEARSLRLTGIAVKMEGENATSYKRIQHFLGKADPRTALWRLFQEDWNPLFCLAKPNKDSPGKLF